MVGARRGVAAVLTLLWVLLGLATAGPAAAHAELLSSDPENGAELTIAPKQVRLTFSERVRPVRKTFSLTDDAGDRLSIVEPTGTSRILVTALPGLAPGFYLFSFRVISVDNHPIRASVAFNVSGKPAAATGQKATAAPSGHMDHPMGSADHALMVTSGGDSHVVSALAGVNRWISYLGAVLLLGIAGFVRLCWATGAQDRRVRILGATGAVLVTLAASAAIPLQSAQVAGTGLGGAFGDGRLGDVVNARYGETMLLRIGFALALLVALAFFARRPGPWPTAAAGAAAVGVAVTYARAGHPAAGEHPAWTMGLDAVHLVAMSVWIGGLLVLAVRMLPDPPSDCAAVLRRWSNVAMVAVVALVITGTIQAARELRSFAAVVDTEYGRWILAKAVLLCGMVALANLGRIRVRRVAVAGSVRAQAGASLGAKLADAPPDEVSRLRRSVAGELVLAAAVLVLTAFLTVTSPPGGHGDGAAAGPAAAGTSQTSSG